MLRAPSPAYRLIWGGLALLIGVWLVARLTDVLVLLAVAVLLAAVMQPPIAWLARRGVPRGAGVLLLYLVLLASLALSIYAFVPLLVNQAGQIVNGSWATWLEESSARIQAEVGRYPGLEPFLAIPTQLGAGVQTWTMGLGRWAVNVSSLLIDAVLVLAIAYFLAVDPNSPRRLLFDLLPEPYHLRMYYLSTYMGRQVVRWAWSQGLLALYIFVFFGVGLYVLGVPYALLLALIGGVLEVIPFLGGAVTMLAAVLVSLPVSWTVAVGAVAWYLVVNLVESYVLIPRLYQRTMRLDPLLVLIAIVVGGRLLGLTGMLLAVPATAAIQAAWMHRDRVVTLSDADEMKAFQDPVCGMRIRPELANATTVYRGKSYHFCSARCHDTFLAWPVDPICHEKVMPEMAEQVTFQGKTYYFCGPEHAARFQEAPESWLAADASAWT